MLNKTITLYNGSDLTPSHDYTDTTDWPNTELASAGNAGEAAAGQWWIRDEAGVIPDGAGTAFLSGHNVVICTVGSNTLFRGRVAATEQFRGRQKAGRAREVTVTLEDQNSHLRGIVVHEWVRPAETDSARAQALVAAYLSGNPRATTNLNGSNLIITGSNAISLPAKTYSGVTPWEVMQELADTTDKEFFVSIDNELAYFGHDYTGYESLLRISDDPADANATTYAPWDPRGNVVSRDELTALRSYYGTDTTQSTVRVTNTNDTFEDYWEELFWDSESVTAAQAASRAQAMLNFRALASQNYTCSIGPMSGDEIWKIKPGQRIQFKSRAARGGRNPDGTFASDSFGNARVREIAWTMPDEDRYIARLQLERPNRTKVPNKGNRALATAPTGAPTTQPDEVVSPTTIYSFLYTTDQKDEQTHTLSGGLDRTTPGNPGSWAPASAYLGAAYGFNDAGHFLSEKLPVSASTQYSFSEKFIFRYTPASRDTYIRWLNGSGSTIREDLFIDGSDYGIGVGYTKTLLLTSPVGTTDLRIRYSNFAGFFADDVYIQTPGSVVAADNDPYALTDPGSSPYYMKSDDPRVLNLIDQMTGVGFSWKMPVRAATTSAGTLASSFENGDSIDGVTLATGDRILIKDQASGAENGIYIVNLSGAPTRAVGMDSDEEVLGAATFVSEGTANANKVFVCTTDAPISLDSTTLTFAQVSGGGVATDTIWDAAGDLAVGTGADTAARLAIGASNTHLVSNGTTALWQSAAFGIPDALSSLASGTGDVTITGSLQDLTGASLSLEAGTWIVHGTFDVIVNNTLNDRTFEGHLDVGGSDQNDIAILIAGTLANDRWTIPQTWRITLSSTTTVKLRGQYSGGTTGDFTSKGANTTIAAYRAGGGSVLGAWTDYTPTLTATTTNPTLGSSTLTGRYKLLDSKTLAFYVQLVITTGGAWNAGSGEWQFSLPSTFSAAANQAIAGTILDSGTKRFVVAGLITGTKVVVMAVSDASGTFTVQHNVPVTWATNDQINLGGIIEIS